MYFAGKLPNDQSEPYVNVTRALPQVKSSAKMSQDQLCTPAVMMQANAPLGPHNDFENYEFPPTASKPKYAMHVHDHNYYFHNSP